MRSITRVVSLALLTGLLTAPLLSTPAGASCVEDSGPSGAEVIFVGTMQEERRGFSRLTVKEVWAGPDLADEVWVLSGQEQARWPFYFVMSVGGSNDVSFVENQEYVVGASDTFSTDDCSISELADEADRPADARQPTPDGSDGADPPTPDWLGTLGLLAFPAALVAALTYRRRQRRLRAAAAPPGA